jgi:hypothetical protein
MLDRILYSAVRCEECSDPMIKGAQCSVHWLRQVSSADPKEASSEMLCPNVRR